MQQHNEELISKQNISRGCGLECVDLRRK